MLRQVVKTTVTAGCVGLTLFLTGCTSSSSSTPAPSVASMADECLQKLTTTINLPLPMDTSDAAGILAYATAVGDCMQKLNTEAGVYCQTSEGSGGVPHQWCGRMTETGTDDVDLSALILSKIPIA